MKRTLRLDRHATGLVAVSQQGETQSAFGRGALQGGAAAAPVAGVLSRWTASASAGGVGRASSEPNAPASTQGSTAEHALALRSAAASATTPAATPAATPAMVATAAVAGDSFPVPAPTAAVVQPVPSAAEAAAAQAFGNDPFSQVLHAGSLLAVVAGFALAGLLLALTPCMYPMYPILSSIVVGQSGQATRWRGFLLALAYSQGMAVVYTGLGVAAALIGGGLAGALQNPWVLSVFALLLVAMALAMFDVYELQVPQALQGRVSAWSNGIQGGRYLGVFVMGMLSGLIVGPCIGPPLAGALFYIGQTKDVLLGAVALYTMALGMSVPLLLIGMSAGSLLPRAGSWMRHVKHFFGTLLLAAALWMVSPVIPAWLVMLLAAVLLVAVGVYLGAFEPLHGHPTPGRTVVKGLGLVLAALAAMLLLGVMSGGRSLLQPLAHWSVASGGMVPAARAATPGAALPFQSVATVSALQAAVRQSTRPVMVDFYADWCVACKELEAFTFTDARVRQQLAGMTLLRVDLTANSDNDAALLRHHQLFGPPALLFFAPGSAVEVSGSRVIGFKNAAEFNAHLARMAPLLRSAASS